MESWYVLQGICDKDSDTTWLEHLLNFLVSLDIGSNCRGMRGIRRVSNCLWSFYSSMDHPVSHWCNVGSISWKRLGSKLARHQMNLLNGSADWLTDATFPSMLRKKDTYNFRWYMPCVIQTSLGNLAKKIKATSAEMLGVCWTLIAIADNMSTMGIATKAISTVSEGTTKGLHSQGLYSKGLHLPCLPEDWSLEAEV